MSAQLDILNCGTGHTEIHFEGDPIEQARAERIIADMIRRGYVLFVHGEGDQLFRVEKFDAEKHVYIVADGPLYAGDDLEPPVCDTSAEAVGDREQASQESPRVARRRGRQSIPVGKVKATAIPRTAGG